MLCSEINTQMASCICTLWHTHTVVVQTWFPYCIATSATFVETVEKIKGSTGLLMIKISKIYFKILTCNLLKLLHTGSNHGSIVFTDADKSKEQDGHKSWYAIIYVVASSASCNKGGKQCSDMHRNLFIRWPYWVFLFLLGRSSPIVCRPTKMWCDSLKSFRKMGEYMSSSFLTSWM